MTRRDLVWAAAYGAHFAHRLEHVLHVEIGATDESGIRQSHVYTPSKAYLERIDMEAREVAELAADHATKGERG